MELGGASEKDEFPNVSWVRFNSYGADRMMAALLIVSDSVPKGQVLYSPIYGLFLACEQSSLKKSLLRFDWRWDPRYGSQKVSNQIYLFNIK